MCTGTNNPLKKLPMANIRELSQCMVQIMQMNISVETTIHFPISSIVTLLERKMEFVNLSAKRIIQDHRIKAIKRKTGFINVQMTMLCTSKPNSSINGERKILNEIHCLQN